MGFLIGLLVNSLLLSVPLGSTLGVLFAIRPFRNDREPIPQGEDGVIKSQFCDEFHTFAQNKMGSNFTINSNEILPEPATTLCMTIISNENSTYPANATVPEFSITWEYPFTIANASGPANETQPLIHAFPQASVATGTDTSVLPLTLEDLGELNLDFEWTMGTGSDNAPYTSLRRLGAEQVNASVALDMYIDPDQKTAGNASAAAFEMLIFFAHFGLQHPVGFGNGTVVTTTTVDGMVFDLFAGQNDNNQNVFSWVAAEAIEQFKGDVSLFYNTILDLPNVVGDKNFKELNVDVPAYGDFLGYVGFGTLAYNSIGNVTFHVPKLSMEVRPFSK